MPRIMQLFAAITLSVFCFADVIADPIQMEQPQQATQSSPRSRSAAAASRARSSSGNVQDSINAAISGQPQREVIIGSRSGQARTAVNTAQVQTAQGQGVQTAESSRVSRGRAARRAAARSAIAAPQAEGAEAVAQPQAHSRTVSPRAAAARSGLATGTATRTVSARASLRGSPIAAAANAGNTARSAVWNYGSALSGIVDDTTGTLSADSYSECLDAYYSCMDDICTARSPGMRRCACSNRTNAHSGLEEQLFTSKENILKVSYELQMLIATKGGDLSAAFQLTDAELSLNCVSYREAYAKDQSSKNTTKTEVKNWCANHSNGNSSMMSGEHYSSSADCLTLGPAGPAYCVRLMGTLGAATLSGSDSDIMTQLQNIASSVDSSKFLESKNEDFFSSLFSNSNLYNDGLGFQSEETCEIPSTKAKCTKGDKDCICIKSKNQTDVLDIWGKDLFDFAHTNVCKRVLDACFAGICGWSYTADANDPTKPLILASNPADKDIDTDCWNKQIKSSIGTRPGQGAASANKYTTANDGYYGLRGPVTQARFSIMQKYHFDANADCDVYGEDLKKQTQNISLQMIAAEQMLKQKRLEFAQERATVAGKELSDARVSFVNCIDQITQCFNSLKSTNEDKHYGWSDNYIKTKCSVVSEIPACYQPMLCDSGADKLVPKDVYTVTKAVAPATSDSQLLTSYRNVVGLNDILYRNKETSNCTTGTGGVQTCTQTPGTIEECLSKESVITDSIRVMGTI
ncbi:MAG: hypothetical protein LBB23_00705 [Rickettsiales bacterium]|nr:hypothetical protein [Rickettsiales bacterium]